MMRSASIRLHHLVRTRHKSNESGINNVTARLGVLDARDFFPGNASDMAWDSFQLRFSFSARGGLLARDAVPEDANIG
ncbi:MAG TPA: hypothetical protein VLK33_03100, partial [Terriglobales bacterium]|nr:hypothetical protein [Terriglobales bacterium]